MKSVSKNTQEMLEALKNSLPVVVTQEGNWYVQNTVSSLFSTEEGRLISIARGLIQAIDELESRPIFFGKAQEAFYAPYFQTIEYVLELLSRFHSPKAFDISFSLLRRSFALRYRVEGVNGGYDTVSPDINESAALRQSIREWKQNQVLISNKELTEDEIERIQETVSYSHFLAFISSNETLRNRFFIWMVRDKMSPAVFIQYPALQEKIESSSLAGRIGRIDGSCLKIKKVIVEEGIQKLVTLPIEGQEENILDENAVHTFRGNYTLTIREIFEIFANKYATAGNLEFLAEGIINWNYLRMGWWNDKEQRYHVVSVHQAEWWKQLPIFEIITLEKAKERFGNHVDGKNWNLAASASRSTATLDYEKTHAYLEVAIPQGNGNYAIYDFGKFANEFPTNMKETLDMFAKNVHASVAYPDESIYYSHREHTHYSFPMTPEQAAKCMKSISEDVLIARANNFVYQIESDNCAKWAQEKIAAGIGEENIPNLFQMHLLATEPFGFVSYLFSVIKKLPISVRTTVLTRLHYPLGAHKGTWITENGKKVCKSLSNHEFFNTGLVYLPCYLHKQKELGMLGSVIDFFEKIVYQTQKTIRRFVQHFFERIENVLELHNHGVKIQHSLLEKVLSTRRKRMRLLMPKSNE